MSDVIFLLIVVGFFFAAVGLLRACERIIGTDDATVDRTTATDAGPEPVEVVAP